MYRFVARVVSGSCQRRVTLQSESLQKSDKPTGLRQKGKHPLCNTSCQLLVLIQNLDRKHQWYPLNDRDVQHGCSSSQEKRSAFCLNHAGSQLVASVARTQNAALVGKIVRPRAVVKVSHQQKPLKRRKGYLPMGPTGILSKLLSFSTSRLSSFCTL